MAPVSRDVTDAELGVLKALWDHGPSTIRKIADTVYPGGGPSEYATVQKLLERLEAKDCVERRKAATPHIFSAIVDREGLIGRRLQEVADSLCGGSLTPLISHLLQQSHLGGDERKELRELVSRLAHSKRSKSERKGN